MAQFRPRSSSVTLCIQRFFQPDQCILSEGSGQSVTVDVVKGRGCSQLLNLVRPDCPSQYPGQVVYSTPARNDTVLLCLEIAIQDSQ